MSTFLAIMTSVLAVCVAIMLVIFLFVPIFKGLSWFVRHIFAFIAGMLQSALRLVGGVLTAVVLVPLILVNVVIGRWSAAGHFGRSLQDEGRAMGSALYRLVVGHPARLFMLTPLVEGIEQRVPQAVAHAPTNDKPNKRAVGQFEGYSIVGSLKAGGSGGKLYVANPDPVKRAAFERQGLIVDQVVIKVFSLADGSSLPQIVRESKSLDAAKRLGLILDHDLTEKRFFYVMPYVPGDTLSVVTNQLHDRAGPAGLSGETLRDALSYLSDLVRTLEQYHRGGLWHKDVKPDNIIVSSGRAHLVDFGLITPLRSAMTLTTHGTEYFRDPEMVRLALKGVKVHEVDGAKFDIYACGAVLYSVIERSFPAHGGLSQITRKCPEAVRWIIRRSMADYDSRYASTRSLLDDLTYVLDAADPFAVKPADLPSMRGGDARAHDETHEVAAHAAAEEARAVRDAAARSPIPPRVNAPRPADAPAAARSPGQRPRIRVTDWLRGGYVVEGGANPAGASGFDPAQAFGAARAAAAGARRSAQDQLDNARARVAARRGRVSARFNGRPIPRSTRFDTRPNAGVAIAFFVFIGLCVLGASLIVHAARKPGAITIVDSEGGARISDGLSTMDDAFNKALAGMDNDFRKAFSDMGQGFKDAFTGVGEAREGVAAAVEAGRRAAAEGVRTGLIASADAAQSVADNHREQASALREKASEIAAGGGRNAARDSRRLLAQADALDKRADSESNRAADMRAKADQASTAANSIPAPNIGGRWLVIDDFPAATSDPAVRSRINNAITVLRGANCELVGLADDPADLELLAAARKSLGVALPTDPAAAERLRGWLASSGENFRGVVWFGKTDERSGVRPVVVVRDGDKASDVSRAVSGKNTVPPVPPVPKAGATPPVSPSTPASPSPTP